MSARRRGASAFSKTILRSIRDSLGRFLAIMGIVALGCGFYAGLQMSGPDMRSAADDLYDGTNLYDIRLVSTMGFTQNDVERVSSIEGVEGVMGARSYDAMARLGPEQLAVRMSSLDVDAAKEGTEQGANAILSDDGTYLNRVFLREGNWPQGSKECVITADKDVAGVEVGGAIEVLYGTGDIDDTLRERTFDVVGKVSSSSYPYTGSFGSTTLGSGMIGEYVYVDSAAFVEDFPFTEIYVRVKGADAYESGSDKYEAAVDAVRERLEDESDALAKARLEDVREDAQEELDDARAEYEEKKADAQKELADAEAKLDDAAAELERGERELKDGERKYYDGVAELKRQRASAYDQLNKAQKEIDDGKAKLANSKKELEAGKAELAEGQKKYDEGLQAFLSQVGASDLSSAKADLQDRRAQATAGIESMSAARANAQQIVEGKAAWAAGRDQVLAATGAASLEQAAAQLEGAIAQMEAASMPEEAIAPYREQLAKIQQLIATGQQLDQAEQALVSGLSAQGIQATDAESAVVALDQAIAQAQEGIAQIDEGLAGVAKLEASKAELEAAAQKIVDGQRQIVEGEKSLKDGQATLDAKRAEAERELANGQAKLDSAYAELRRGRAELESGRAEYEDGLAEYERGKAEADQKLADAQQQIDDAQQEIDDLEEPDIYLLDRTQNEGTATYDADTHRMDSIADVFPLMFFLVAALVALTTMTRMVDDDRVEIGTYKALGYSTPLIASKYLWYAGTASAVGAAVGILALSQLLPFIVICSYAIIYTIPIHPFPLPIDLGIAFAAGGLGVGVTLVATYVAVVASLRETPATLMLPRAPVAGKRILLERVGPIWRRLSFSWKVTCRNLFRYKRRMAMTVIGISGCTALLLVGYGLHDAIWDIIDCQYGPIIHYDLTVGLKSDVTELDVTEVMDYLESTGEVTDIIRMQQENMQAGSDAGDLEPMRVQVLIPRSPEGLEQAVTLRNRISQEAIPFDGNSVVVTEKVSIKYGIEVGSEILLYDQDDIGNVVGKGHPLTVTGITENYVGNIVYVGRDAWKGVDRKTPVFSTILASATEDAEERGRIADELHDFGDVSTVIFADESVNLYSNMLSVVDSVVYVLIVSAGLLAFIVLYNLTNINIGERVREIASLKVLGFTKREVYAYIFREIALLAVLGDALGMVFGTYLETFVATTAEVDYVMFGRTIHPLSYVYGFVITLVFTALILLVMRRKLDCIDMVESLKSVD